jgi:CXXX repeat modification system protein
MQSEKVGHLTEDEKNEILKLYERKSALNELFVTLASPYLSDEERTLLKGAIAEDLETTNTLYDRWWRLVPKKYGWKSNSTGHWRIEFETNEVVLETPEAGDGEYEAFVIQKNPAC